MPLSRGVGARAVGLLQIIEGMGMDDLGEENPAPRMARKGRPGSLQKAAVAVATGRRAPRGHAPVRARMRVASNVV